VGQTEFDRLDAGLVFDAVHPVIPKNPIRIKLFDQA
jgi:hypothetical protein